jgi:hypothetical protein
VPAATRRPRTSPDSSNADQECSGDLRVYFSADCDNISCLEQINVLFIKIVIRSRKCIFISN